jgi:hypothetical protein
MGYSFFINHLHQYFGYLMHCSAFGSTFDRYNGSTNMYHIHKYMGYTNAQEQYTNEQFYLSAKRGYKRLTRRYRRIVRCRGMRRVRCMIRFIRRCLLVLGRSKRRHERMI